MPFEDRVSDVWAIARTNEEEGPREDLIPFDPRVAGRVRVTPWKPHFSSPSGELMWIACYRPLPCALEELALSGGLTDAELIERLFEEVRKLRGENT